LLAILKPVMNKLVMNTAVTLAGTGGLAFLKYLLRMNPVVRAVYKQILTILEAGKE
jgi:hypothetical protein